MKDAAENTLSFPCSEIPPNLLGFPVFPKMAEEFCVRTWRLRKRRAESLYIIALLLARECRLRADEAEEEDTWTFDALDVQRTLIRVDNDERRERERKRNRESFDYEKGKTKTNDDAE